ncbi:hypothetical protein SASPL_106247 [Salvia splendens]|uniref:Solute carrier family 15 (Peptide/histidine transporter), member 3/4 n=1 Tax=Salvia splendens TaxID=180675 RepID=A0A8X9ACC1_SALSN|nr:hypothetical protein SASPL_106247 [Salvia splendens]
MGILGNENIQHRKQAAQGGRRATLFVFAMTALETMTFLANGVSLVTYFYGYMNFGLTKSATTLTNFMGTAFLLSLFGGFISDTYLSRFKSCIVFGCLEILGYTLLAVQAHMKQLRPFPCKDVDPTKGIECESASDNQEAILFTGLYLVALGVGGIRAAVPALGADQFEEDDTASLSSFFNWYMFSVTVGASFGVTFLVWISTNQGWDWSFGVCAMAVAASILFLAMGRSAYRTNVPKATSPLVRILQVLVVAVRNKKLPVPDMTQELHEVHDKEVGNKDVLQRTDQFKYLDRAAIPRNSEDAEPWRVCTVTQVEETKILIRMLPIIVSTIFMNTCLAQLQTFTIQQSMTMDTSLGSFQVPGPSIPVIPLVFMAILLPIYDRFFVPLARKVTGIPTGITQLQRVGVGLVLSIISMAVSGVVETRRKRVAVEHNMVDSAGPLQMSVFWLGIQYAIFGMADMFTVVGLLDFFYAESSAGMKSLGTAISWCSLAFGYYTSTVVVNVVNKVSQGWLSTNNLNRDRLEYFYWLLALLSLLNFGFYLLCASWYKYKKLEMEKAEDRIDITVSRKSSH